MQAWVAGGWDPEVALRARAAARVCPGPAGVGGSVLEVALRASTAGGWEPEVALRGWVAARV
ncbi:hypothetical protein [Streptomyces sp. NPDC047042]|uniref:hypothetical protein n=1 Tax=Streptomyces sp. NPDC047042 TaxID=3154807 RepID=UPI003400A476